MDDSDDAKRPRLRTGSVLGRYVLLEPVGEGGMGVVHRAYDPDLDRTVAIKVVHPRGEHPDEARRRLVREARAMARVIHPNIVRVHDVGEVGGDVFIAVDLVDGSTLEQWLRAQPRSLTEILAVFERAGRGLAAAHDSGLVHRDFKPDNVLVSAGPEGIGVFVTDFGLARETTVSARARLHSSTSRADVEITRDGDVVGTPAYMAPEQLRSGALVDARADQFAFCIALWEAVCGERPFQGESVDAILSAVMRRELTPPPPGSRMPGWLRRALLRGLQRAPADRYPSMESLLHELEAVPRRRRRLVALAAAVTVCVAAGAVSLWRARRDPCRDAGEPLAVVWNDARRDAEPPGFATAVDAHASAWLEAAKRACAATRVHGEQSTRVLATRERCLDHAVMRLSSLLDASRDADPALRAKAAWSLPLPAACLRGPAPSSAIAGERLAVAEAMLALDRLDDAETAIADALARADEDDDAVTRVEAALAHAQLQRARGDAKPSEDALHVALERADAIAHDVAAARGWAALTSAAAAVPDRAADTRRLAVLARAAADRVGDDRARAEVEAALARIADGGDAAHTHLVQAATLRERVDGTRHPEVAALLQADARALLAANRNVEAIAAATRALAIAQDVLDDARAIAEIRLLLADALAAAGERDAAAAQRARAAGGGA